MFLILVLFIGANINGTKAWINIFGFSFQPSEFIKVITIVWMASYYEKNAKKLEKYNTCLIPIGVAAIPAFLIFRQPDLGTTIIYAVIVFSMFCVSPIKKMIKIMLWLVKKRKNRTLKNIHETKWFCFRDN